MKKKFLFLTIALLTALVSWAQDSPTYNLTVSVNNEQGATPNGSGQYEAGQKVYVYVNVTSDYKLAKWTEDGKDIESDVTRTGFTYVMPDHDVELKAYVNYDPKTPGDPVVDHHIYYTLTVVTKPTNARVNMETYHLEAGKTQTLGYPTPDDYRFLGWYHNGKLISKSGNYEFNMPDHDVTLERQYTYDPTVPANPGANTWYLIDDGTVELIIDDFQPGGVSNAVEKAQRLHKFDINNVTSIIVKGEVYESDCSQIYRLENLQNVDFTRTNLKRVRDQAWNKTGITTVKLPSSLESIGSNAFSNCSNLKNIVCLALTPPEVNSSAFNGVHEGAFLYVPAASVELYQEADVWKDFIIYPLIDELSSLNVTLPLACSDGRCKDMRLEVVNAKSGVRQKYIITDRMTYTYDLVYDCTYHVRIVSQKGEILSQVENIELGRNTIDVTLPDLKELYDVTLSVIQNNGIDVTDEVTAKWYDAEGNYIASGQQVSQLTEGYQLSVAVTLPEALARVCKLPERVEHTVTVDDNKITVTLHPLVQKTLTALVVNDEGGTYLNGAWVQATQTINGRYNHNASGATDNYGMSDLTLYSDVPATITVSHNGYYTESVNIDNIAELEYLPTVRLKSFKGITVGLLMNGYDDYNDLVVSVHNNTKENNVNDIRFQYPYLVLPESVDSTDVLAITAHSQVGQFEDVTQTMTVSDLKVTLDIVAKGSLEAKYGTSQNESVLAMVYNSEGRLVDAKSSEARKATFSYLPTGNYTVVMMGCSKLFEGISSLTDFKQLGLAEKKDYVMQTINVQQGVTSVADFASVPLFVEGKFSYISNNASFICTSTNPRNGYAATFRADIDFKEDYRDDISNLRLIIDYDDKTEFVKSSVVLNTKLHDYAQGEQSVEIDDLANGDEVKFCLMPIEDGLMTTTAYVEFDYDGQHLRQPLGTVKVEVSSVVLVVPEVTPLPEVNLNLKNIPYGKYNKVEFYDNGVLIGTIPDLSSTASYIVAYDDGGYSARGDRATLRCKLHDPYYYSYHNIQAKLTDTDGKLLLTETKTMQYDPFAAVLSDMGVYCPDNKNGLNMGTISRTNSSKRVYCGRPKRSGNGDGYVNLTYYGHFLHNEYLPNLVKNVKLTKFILSDKTESMYMGLWCDLPNDQLGLHDDVAYDQRYLKYGENLIHDRKVFLTGESCPLHRTPRNMTITFDYNEDFERPEDTASNNRFVKQMKAAMAEKQIIANKIEEANRKIDQELNKSELNWDSFLKLLEERHEHIVQYCNGLEATLNKEQEKLFKDLKNVSEKEEFIKILNQMFPDFKKQTEYHELEELNNTLNTSTLYFAPMEIGNGYWTPAITYEIGTPNTGFFLEDMSDGNWHAEKLLSEENQSVIIYVNDKGGDRLTIDFSKNFRNASSRRNNKKAPDSDFWTGFWDTITPEVIANTVSLTIGQIADLSIFAEKNWVLFDEFGIKYARAYTQTFPTAENQKFLSFYETINDLDKAAFDAEKAANIKAYSTFAQVAGVAINTYVGYKNGRQAFNNYEKDVQLWNSLIEAAENGCDHNDPQYQTWIAEAKSDRNDTRIVRGSNIVLNACLTVAGNWLAVHPGAGKFGLIAPFLLAGVDGVAGGIQNDYQKITHQNMKSFANAINSIPGCNRVYLTVPTNDDFTVQWLTDPSGYVYEAVPSNRIEGATASCYYKDSIQNEYGDWEVKEVLWDAENYEAQVNPQITNSEGRYGWDVPQGMWQVRYEKDGFEPTRSEWLPVPPPQLEVNIPMVQRTAPEVEMAHVYQDGIELLFSKYMQPETLTPDMLKVKVVRNGKETLLSDIKVELLNEEAEAKGSTITFASLLRLTSEIGWQDADEVLLIVDRRVKSYCGVPMQEDYMQHLDIEKRIEKIEAEEKLEMAVGESQELKISVVPAEAGAGKMLYLTPSFNELVDMSPKEVVLDAEGKASVTLTGKTIGSTSVTLNIDGEMAEELVMVEVLDPDNLFVDMPLATPGSGSVLREGETVTLSTTTKDAQIYYTTDGSCPCDEQGTRQLYTGPINIYGETVIKAQAVREGWYDSGVATFVFTLDSPDGVKNVNRNVHPSIYDLQGRKVDIGQAHRGIYIVVGEGDSKPRKTFIK